MSIGEAAKASGVSAKMIRYYESVGLIRPAARSEAGYRLYGEEGVHALRFVRRARSLGFPLDQVAALLDLWRDKGRASSEVKAVAMRHVRDLKTRIAEMQVMVRTLSHLADHCSGDDRPDCPILDDLAGTALRPPAGTPDSQRRAEHA